MGNLGLMMTSNVPKVMCRWQQAPPADRCKRIIDTMRYSALELSFGIQGDRSIRPDVMLPRYLRERE